MISKEQRLTTELHKKINQVGKKYHGPSVSIHAYRSEGTAARIAVVVSKKVYSKAVLRNKTRRKVFDIIREVYPQIGEGWNLSIVVRSKLLEVPSAELTSTLFQQLRPFLIQTS